MNMNTNPVEQHVITGQTPEQPVSQVTPTKETNQSIPDKDIDKYRNLAMAFINQHKHDLVKIFLQHSREASDEDRIGVLGINLFDFNNTGKVDVAYLPVKMLEAPIAQRIQERIKENEIHIIYFLMITPYEEQILEVDVRSLMD